MPSDISFLEFASDSEQDTGASRVFSDYLLHIANKKMRTYKQIIHTRGEKQGQSYYSHVIDLVTIAEKLRSPIGVDELEMRCVLLALTIHDLNKIPPYGKRTDGREEKYADAASAENIQSELERLDVDDFFPEWREYLQDIVLLAHFHQESATGTTLTLDQRIFEKCMLRTGRLKGPLKHLMKAADTADNSHSGDHRDPHETHIRDKLLQHINSAMPERQYRFFGHRLAELRGLFTNVMHNELVRYFRERYGEGACIDLQYYTEGVNYLLDKQIALEWTPDTMREVAARIENRLADIKIEALVKFIKAQSAGIVVDDAAIESGASTAEIFNVITNIVHRKQYKQERSEERTISTRNDLQEAFTDAKRSTELKERVAELLKKPDLIPTDEVALKRGEFASAYRKFLEDHRAYELKALKVDAWTRIYRLFGLPETNDAIYRLINPYRRGYFMARDLPDMDLNQMEESALADIALLDEQISQARATGIAKKTKENDAIQPTPPGQEESAGELVEAGYLVDYLKVNLEVWDSGNSEQSHPVLSKPIMTTEFGESLRRYASERQYKQCCHCGTALRASEWMSLQVPDNIGVQNFSNRLEGGSSREPKRNVCAVCRAQFILERLAWRSHRDKQGAEQVTFYLHLFPYAFFTQPLLRAWWMSVNRLRDSDHTAFFLNTRDFFRNVEDLQEDIRIEGSRTTTNGLGLPTISEALSNTPVLPIIAPGDNYGSQFMLALEMAVILARWFECRAILSRSPIPLINLSKEKIGDKPVALMIEGMPRNMSWLVPETSMPREQVELLCRKFRQLHRLSKALYYAGSKSDDVPHDFAVAAADDELALYYEADRLIEKKVDAEKGRMKISPEQHAISLSRQVAPILQKLVEKP
jgi:CRISPR-associated protein Csc3